MFDLLLVPNFIKIGENFSFRTKFRKFLVLGQGHQFQLIISMPVIISMLDLFWVANIIKIWHITFLRPSLPKFFILGLRSAISDIIFMINELDLLWLPNIIALGIYFIFGTKFSWSERIDTCSNVKWVLIGRILIFLVFT